MNQLTNAALIANDPGWLIVVKAIMTFAILVVFTLMAIWWERRLIGFMQERPGPNRTGPQGLLQSLADGVKLALKEDLIPTAADKVVFILAPIISATTCFMSFAIMPMTGEVKLFGKWDCDQVDVDDISLKDYIPIKGKAAKYLPHTAGRYQVKRFRKALCPIVERLVCSLMMHGRNNGKKLMAVRIVKHTFEIIHLLTGENPLKILVDAIKNSGPREDSTRIGSGGTVRK